MKLCFLAAANSIHSYRWVKFFAEQGHEVHWIYIAPNNFEPLRNVAYYEMPRMPLPGLTVANAIIKTKKLLDKIKPDVLHAHYAGTYGLIGALSGVRPFLLTAWGSDILIAPKSVIKRPLIKLALNRAELITCDADHMSEAMVRLGVDKNKIKVIYFGIDTKKFRPMERTDILSVKHGISGSPVVISLRNLEPIYNVESLVKAVPIVLRQLPDAKFVIGGTGSEEGRLKELAGYLGALESIRFIGRYSNEDLPGYLNAADVYVSTSLSDAGIAASTAEAMACGVPVIVTDSGENRKWVEDGENGFVVPVRSPQVLAEKIITLLKNDNVRKQFGMLGKKVISERNDYYNEMEKMEALYGDFIHAAKN